MTTVIRTRMPLETLTMSQQTERRRRSKRLLDYDEEDGDFVFKRGSKRTKTVNSEPEPTPASAHTTIAKRGRKPKERDENVVATVKKAIGKKTDFATPRAESVVTSKPRRRSTRLSSERAQNGEEGSHVNGTDSVDLDGIDLIGETHTIESREPIVDASKHSTTISLPFSDTPVINRNKELRKKGNGTRRSSLGMRGRRASSLIDNGHSAIPHREVETTEFYKHIESDLIEPRRMKQLLTWTGERAMGERPSHGKDSAAELAARVIKEQLLKDFGSKSEFSDWFNREESVPTKIIKKPNPRNIEMQQKLVELEERINSLKSERDQWKALSKPPPSLPPILPPRTTSIQPSHINASLLDPEQAAILATLTTHSADHIRANAKDRLQTLYSSLEFKVDQFADGVHKLEQYQHTVGRVADKILALSAVRLEERERKEKEAVGTRDLPMQEVLRSLSRILPDSSGGGSNR